MTASAGKAEFAASRLARPPVRRAVLAGAIVLTGAGLVAVIVAQLLSATSARLVRDGYDRLVSASSSLDDPGIRADARAALDQSPLEAGAVSLLGTVEDRRGRRETARELMTAASALSRRDLAADLWLLEDDLRRGDDPAAFAHADAIMRRRPDMIAPVAKALFPFLGEPGAVGAMAVRLAAAPPWREAFFARLSADPQSFTRAYPLMAAVKTAGGSPSAAEMEGVIGALWRGGRYEEAYLSWLLLLPQRDIAQLGNVYDSDFEGWGAPAPFGWTLGDGAEKGRREIAPSGQPGASALHVTYDGYSSVEFARQALVLPAGAYQLSGEIRTDSAESDDRTAWSLSCEPGRQVLASLPAVATGGAWRKFSARFTVPADCKAQRLALNSMPGERRTTVGTWYHHMAIAPAPAGGAT